MRVPQLLGSHLWRNRDVVGSECVSLGLDRVGIPWNLREGYYSVRPKLQRRSWDEPIWEMSD